MVATPTGPPQNIPSLPHPPTTLSAPPHTRQGLKGGSSLRASRSSQLMWRKKGCFCGVWGCQAASGGSSGTPCPPLYLHVGRVTGATPDPLAGVPLEELEEKQG